MMSAAQPAPAAPIHRTAALLVVAVVAATVALLLHWPRFWVLTGIGEPGRPFLDLYGLLAARDAVNLGLDPFVPGPLDPYHRPHVYTTWWLAFPSLELGRADVWWLGSLLGLATLLATVGLVAPRSWREAGALLAVLLSPALLFAAHRANNDLVVLVVIAAGLAAWRRGGWGAEGVAAALFALAAVLKYYPLILAAVLLPGATRRSLGWRLLAFGVVLLVALPGLLPGLRSAGQHTPVPTWLYAFGAPVLGRDFGFASAALWIGPGLVLVGTAAGLAWRRRRVTAVGGAEAAIETREFLAGALLLVGLFFLGASYLYKFIFAVLLLPRLWRSGPGSPDATWLRAIHVLLYIVLWLEGLGALLLNTAGASLAPARAEQVLLALLVVAQVAGWALVFGLTRQVLVDLLDGWRAGRAAPAAA